MRGGARRLAKPPQAASLPPLIRGGLQGLAAFADEGCNLLIHQAFLAVVGHGGESVIKLLKLFAAQIVAQVFGALVERVAAAMFAEHQAALRHAD
jgi:hypothetical protein